MVILLRYQSLYKIAMKLLYCSYRQILDILLIRISIGDSFTCDHSCNLVYPQYFLCRHGNHLLPCQDLGPVRGILQCMCLTRSVVRPLKVEYFLSILGRTIISPKRYANSKFDNFTCNCNSERIVLMLVRVALRRNTNVFSSHLFIFMRVVL